MKITCDECGKPIAKNDRVVPLKGAFKNKEMILGYSTKQIKYFWEKCRFDATCKTACRRLNAMDTTHLTKLTGN